MRPWQSAAVQVKGQEWQEPEHAKARSERVRNGPSAGTSGSDSPRKGESSPRKHRLEQGSC